MTITTHTFTVDFTANGDGTFTVDSIKDQDGREVGNGSELLDVLDLIEPAMIEAASLRVRKRTTPKSGDSPLSTLPCRSYHNPSLRADDDSVQVPANPGRPT